MFQDNQEEGSNSTKECEDIKNLLTEYLNPNFQKDQLDIGQLRRAILQLYPHTQTYFCSEVIYPASAEERAMKMETVKDLIVSVCNKPSKEQL